MLQEHGLDARPYDCSKCTLKFFFSAELDHHVLTFHRPDSSSVESVHETKTRESKKRDNDVTVKEEVMQSGKEKVEEEEEKEEEEVNVDDQVEHHEEAERNEQKLKTEINNEATSGRMES